jgi:hypothetical protein
MNLLSFSAHIANNVLGRCYNADRGGEYRIEKGVSRVKTGLSGTLAILFSVAFAGFGCSSHHAARTNVLQPVPAVAHSLMFEPASPYQSAIYRELTGVGTSKARPYSVVEDHYEGYQPIQEPRRPLVVRALSKLAGAARNVGDGSIESILDRYEQRFDRIERGFEKVETYMTDEFGLEKNDFRQGLGVTAAAAATTIGTIHALAPTYTTGDIFGTGLRAGYDLRKIDDPRMVLDYQSRARVMLSRNGIGGSYGTDSGVVYSADLNVRRQIAAANLSLPAGITLGTQYEHPNREVKGYVSMGF